MPARTRYARYFVSYDVNLPNKKLLITGIIAGVALTILGAVLLVVWFNQQQVANDYEFWKSYNYSNPIGVYYNDGVYEYKYLYDSPPSPQPPYVLPWVLGAIVGLSGIVILTFAATKYRKFYVTVRQGRVIDRDTVSGGIGSLRWMLLVEGNTLANTRRQQWISVSGGTYSDYRRGDFIDFR